MSRRSGITAVALLLAFAGLFIHSGVSQNAGVRDETEMDILCSRIQRESSTVSEDDVIKVFNLAKDDGRPLAAALATKGYLARQSEISDRLALAAIENAYLAGNLRGAVSRSKAYLSTANADEVSSDVAARMCAAQIDFFGAQEQVYRYMSVEGKMFRRSDAARKFDAWFLDQAANRKDYKAHAERLVTVLKDQLPIDEEKLHFWRHLDWLMNEIKQPSDKKWEAASECRAIAGLIRGDEVRKGRCAFLAENLAFEAAAVGKSKADLDAGFAMVTAAASAYIAKSPTAGALIDILDTFGGQDAARGFSNEAQGEAKRNFFVKAFPSLPAKDRDTVMSWQHQNRLMAQLIATPQQWTQLAVGAPTLFANPDAVRYVPFDDGAKDKNAYVQLARVLDGVYSATAAAIRTLAATDTPAAAGEHLYRNESWYLGSMGDLRAVFAGKIIPAMKAMSGKTGEDADREYAQALIEFDRKYIAGTPAALDIGSVRDYAFNAWRNTDNKTKMSDYLDAVGWVPFNPKDDAWKRSRVFETVNREFGDWAKTIREHYDNVKRDSVRFSKSLPPAEKRTAAQEREVAEWEKRVKLAEDDANNIAAIGESVKNAKNDLEFAPERAPDELCGQLAVVMKAAYDGNAAEFAKAATAVYPAVRDYRAKKTPLGHAIVKFLANPPRRTASIDLQVQILGDLLTGWKTGSENPEIEDIATAIMTSRDQWNWWAIPGRNGGNEMAKQLNAVVAKELTARMDRGEWDRKLFDWLRATRRGPGREGDMDWNVDLFLRVLKEQKVDVGTMMYLARAEWRLPKEYSSEFYFDDAFVKQALSEKWLDINYWNQGGKDPDGKVRAAAAKIIGGYERIPLGYGDGVRAYAPADYWRWHDEALKGPAAAREAMLNQIQTLYGKTRFDVAAMGADYFYQQGSVKSPEQRRAYFTKLSEYLDKVTNSPDRPQHPNMVRITDLGGPGNLAGDELAVLRRMFSYRCRPADWPRGNHYEEMAIYLARGLMDKDRDADLFAVVPHLWRIVASAENPNVIRAMADVARDCEKAAKWELASALSSVGLEVCGGKLAEADRNSLTQIQSKALSNFDVIPVSPSDPRYQIYQAQAHYMSGNFEQAWKSYLSDEGKVMTVFKELDPSFITWLIDRNTGGGNFEEAEALARVMIQWMDTTPDALPKEARLDVMLSYANIAFTRPEYPRAKAIYGQIVAAREFDGLRGQIDAELRMADIDLQTGAKDESVNRLEKLLKKQDRYIQSEANYLLAKVRFEQKDFTSAREVLEKVFSVAANHPDGRILEAKVQLQLRRVQDATRVKKLGITSEQRRLVPGRPLSVSVEDQTLSVVGRTTHIEIMAWTESGDSEIFTLKPFSDSKTQFIGEVPTALAPAKKDDGMLQVLGGDKVRYDYSPAFKKENNITDTTDAALRTVSASELYASSATIISKQEAERSALQEQIKQRLGLREEESGDDTGVVLSEVRAGNQVKPGNDINVRVFDMDRSVTPSNDVIDVKVTTTSGDSIIAFPLKETEGYSAVFEGVIPTEPAPAAAFATDSEEGTSPAFPISSGDHPAWSARPDDRRPKSFTADLNDNVLFGTMKITANVPGRRIRDFTLQSSQNGVNYRTIGGWPVAYQGWDGAPRATVVKLEGDDVMKLDPNSRSAGARGPVRPEFDSRIWGLKSLGRIRAMPLKSVHCSWGNDVLGQAGALQIGGGSHYVVHVKAAWYTPKRVVRTFRLRPLAEGIDMKYDFVVDGGLVGKEAAKKTRDPDAVPPPPWTHRAAFTKGVHTLEVLVQASSESNPGFEILCDTNTEPYMVPCPADMFDPSQHPEILEGITESTATITPSEDGGMFDVAFSEGARGRALRMVMHDFETDAPAINKIMLRSADGADVLPTKVDLLALHHNKILEIIPGDKIAISYKDPSGVERDDIVHESFLDATYADGSILAGLVVGYKLDKNGLRVPELAKLYRYDPGDTIDVTISDPDNDTSDEQDIVEFQAKVFGKPPFTLKAQETAEHSGVFNARIFPVEEESTRESEIQVQEGDDIELFYKDVENLDPGVPWLRTARIERNWYQDPEFRAYDAVTIPLGSGGSFRGLPPAPPRDDRGKGAEKITPMYALVATRPKSAEAPEEPTQVVMRGPLLAEIYWPTIAKSSVSKATVYAQSSRGRTKYGAEIPEGLFDINVPGTIKLTSGLGTGATMPVPLGYSGCGVEGQPDEEEIGGIGTFMFGVPTTIGDPPEESLINAGEEGGPDASEAVLRIRDDDRIYVGFQYKDLDGAEYWLSREFVQNPPGALLDIMNQDYMETLTNVHVGNSAYLRTVDVSKDLTDERDRVIVEVVSTSGSTNELEMTETFAHSAIFKGTVKFQHEADVVPTNAVGILPVTYGATVTASYSQNAGTPELERRVSIFKGANADVMPFSKRFKDPSIAVRTQLAIAEAWFELAKQHRELKQVALSRQEIKEGKRILEEAVRDYPDTETRAQADYLLANLSMEFAEDTDDKAEKKGFYEEAALRFRDIVTAHSETTYAPRAQYKYALALEKLGEFDSACEEYVKLSYRWPDNELIAETVARLGQYFYRNGRRGRKLADGKEDPVEREEIMIETRKQFVTAAEVFGRLIVKFPSHSLAEKTKVLSGQCYMRADEFEDAVKAFKVIADNKDADKDVRAEAMYWCGDSLLKQMGIGLESEGGQRAPPRWGGDPKDDPVVQAYRMFKNLTWDYPATVWAKYARARLAEGQFASVEDVQQK